MPRKMMVPIMRRRSFLLALGGSALLPSLASAQSSEASLLAWNSWKAAFLAPEGRVVDALQGGISHSEGQGYGMVLASAFADHSAFEAMRRWTEQHLAVRQDALLAWRWSPDEPPEGRDYNNASDGDLFYAWALLRGARRFGDASLLDRARAVCEAIAQILIVEDPRGSGQLLLLPGAEHFRTEEGVIVNTSYIMPLALHELAAAFELPRLADCAEDGAELLWTLAEAGFLPDWIEVTADGWHPSPLHSPVSGYEAMRAPLWLIWSGRPAHPAVRNAANSPGSPVPVVTDLSSGEVLERSNHGGYAALSALAGCATREPTHLPEYTSNQPYYPATLHLLALIAARESLLSCT